MTTDILGMYRVNEKDYPKIKIGRFTICRQDANSVWIQTADGEGAQFTDRLFERAIEAFYAEHF